MRNEIKLTDSQLEDKFSELFFVLISIEDIELTRDTIDDFKSSAKNYREHKKITERSVNGLPILEIKGAQVRKGDQRTDMHIIDFGNVRACFFG